MILDGIQKKRIEEEEHPHVTIVPSRGLVDRGHLPSVARREKLLSFFLLPVAKNNSVILPLEFPDKRLSKWHVTFPHQASISLKPVE